MRVYGKQFAWLNDSDSAKTGEMGLPIQRLAEWYDRYWFGVHCSYKYPPDKAAEAIELVMKQAESGGLMDILSTGI
jgi:hypothetical protein